MPKPLPSYRVLEIAIKYISHRQIQGRVTTLRQFATRCGLGVSRLKGMFEKNKVEYVLLPHQSWRSHSIEILIKDVPQELADLYKIDRKLVQRSYGKLLKEAKEMDKVEKIAATEDSPGFEMTPEEEVDPYLPYRINDQQFAALIDDLIEWSELLRIALDRGYSKWAIYRATGGPMMRYVFPSEVWRPYIVGKKRYFLREVLKHLPESDKTYKSPIQAIMKRQHRAIVMQEKANPINFTTKEELWSQQKIERVQDYWIR